MPTIETVSRGAAGQLRPLAEGVDVPNDTLLTGLNNNDLIIGPSGCGKTGGYVIPNLLAAQGSIVVADTKRNLVRRVGPILRRRGYAVHVIDFVEPEKSTPYNPLDYLRIDPRTGNPKEQDVMTIASAIVTDTDKDEPFWDMSARTVVACLVSYVMECFPPKQRSLNTVVEVFRALCSAAASERDNDRIGVPFLESHGAAHPESFAYKKYLMFKPCISAEKTWSCVTQFVSVAIDAFDYEEARVLLSGSGTFRLESLGSLKSVVFLNISDTDRTFDKMVNLFYTQAIQVLCRTADRKPDSRLRIPVRLILDDFATNAFIPGFDKIISVIRSREISVSIILQSLTQLSTMYSEAASATIVNNCDHILYMGGTDVKTTDYVAFCTNKPRETVVCLPLDAAILITRGQRARQVRKLKPYACLPTKAKAQQEEPR